MSARSLVSVLVVVGLLATAAILGIVVGQGTAGALQALSIEVTPATDVNEVNTDHTVTATVTSEEVLGAVPQPEVTVTFEIVDGPNLGDNSSETTDINGEAAFTYTGDGGIGTDTIQVCLWGMLQAAATFLQEPIDCVDVYKEWVEPTPTPTASPTPTATATPTATPTVTPTPAEVADVLPPTGSEPGGDGGFPWAVLALALGGLAVVAGGAALLKRAR